MDLANKHEHSSTHENPSGALLTVLQRLDHRHEQQIVFYLLPHAANVAEADFLPGINVGSGRGGRERHGVEVSSRCSTAVGPAARHRSREGSAMRVNLH